MTRLILVRHGETAWNVQGRYQGQADPPLNERGLAQAHRLAGQLKDKGLAHIYASPLQRALQTARVLTRRLDLSLREEPRLMEIHQGSWQGRLQSEIASLYPDQFEAWLTDPWRAAPPGGESLPQVQERVHAALDDVLDRHCGQCLALVSHRIPIILIKIRCQDLDPGAVRRLQLPNMYWEELHIP